MEKYGRKKGFEEQKKRLLELFHHKDYVPMKVKELAILFGGAERSARRSRQCWMHCCPRERSEYPRGESMHWRKTF
ncbi:MAG: hypothetical protein V8S96_07460 [Lachnospiraceae bacterium]